MSYNMIELLFHVCATIPLALQLAWLEDVGSTVGHNPIHRSISIFPLSLGRTDGRREDTVREGRHGEDGLPLSRFLLIFSLFCAGCPSVVRPSLIPPSTPSPSPPCSPLPTPFLRLCTEIRFADPPLNEIPRGRAR